jgi:hypothetical protein
MNINAKQLLFVCATVLGFSWACSATTHYVNVNGSNPTSPYTSWTTAATIIQDAVDSAVDGDLVLVTNGTYQTGGRLYPGDATTNRVVVTNNLTLQSVNGPTFTSIVGYQVPGTTNGPSAIRCIYQTSGNLSGFTITGGATTATSYVGGGIDGVYEGGPIVSNCVITGNWAYYVGGGVSGCVLYNCTISGNWADSNGGGVDGGTLFNCLVSSNSCPGGPGGGLNYCFASQCIISGNSAGEGGGCYRCQMNDCLLTGNSAAYGGGTYQCGVYNCTIVGNQGYSFGGAGGGTYGCNLDNCIVYFNTSLGGGAKKQNYSGDNFYNCCTTPMPTNGLANFTSPPLFVNQATGDYHLQSNSPCINAGNNNYSSPYFPTSPDLDGNPRIAGGTVDVGAYEYQTPTSILSYAWAQQFGILTDGSAAFADPDGDGMNNWEEWIAGTNPTNALSVLALLAPAFTNSTGVSISWQSVSNQTYYLERATNLASLPAFAPLQSNIVGHTGLTTILDSTATNSNNYFYRMGVQQPYGNVTN